MNWYDGQSGAGIKAGLVILWFALWFGVERWHHRPADKKRFGRNIGLWLVNSLMSPLLVLPISAWACGHALNWRPDDVIAVMIDILILDLAIYGWHRWCHHQPLLWRFHRIHHLDRHLDTTTALRFHGGEVLLSAIARAGLILVLDIEWVSVVIFETLVLCSSIFQHADIRLSPRLDSLLSRVIVTPAWHHLHHHPDVAHTNSNYATIFSCWDHLFTSHNKTIWQDDMPSGLDDLPDLPLWKLMVRPFRQKSQNFLPKSGRAK